MTYMIEAEKEFERLEFQAKMRNYDFRKELNHLEIAERAQIVDAGSGSGVVSRYLAEAYPQSSVTGFDFSELRVRQAQRAATGLSNLCFKTASLDRLPISSAQVDLIVCRFVLEHLSATEQKAVLDEFYRCLKPGGRIIAIDVDGWFQNIYPSTPWIDEVVAKCNRENPIDLRVGRKIPTLLETSGFKVLPPRIELMNFEGEELEHEKQLIRSRLAQAAPFLNEFLESNENVTRFGNDVLHCLNSQNSVLYYCKFIVTGVKPDRVLRSLT
ncbi:MAG TPA: hypothetical protein DCS07_12225 [Bdellovibrionales bacterium]|nr:MAG: hypothetical protein A2Z97_08645 [Bdellovibrionales bacterium GWB1_52_6]OFZ02776.1 MAG: hypothetical protein A2X97_04175 [Bdellovibrionales bacterium GWA1_52_35]OFZ44139.1 MAG: hypothetical protein A2070_07230 [Bdellovibrionales bacterium GWC1_52_8]HAR43376.1 hypothetical protein [Bdellovibrionales bacterium]HCM38357.1 hypothetical protein [Bdellovibrionales bacterium]